ncbi:MAG: hypothetical protein ABI175_01550 [Polyangiales bacterium]
MIEHRLLELAYTTDAKITAPVLAYFARCSIENAEKVLDGLVARDRISMDVSDDGTIVYEVPDRQKLTPRKEGPEPLHMIPAPKRPMALRNGATANPGLAAVFSLLLPGAGQAYVGRPLAAVMWFIVVSLGYLLILPGLFLHLLSMISAAGSAHRLNSNIARMQLQAG